MKIELAPSLRMTARQHFIERRSIRIPEKYRTKLDLSIGQFINLETVDGSFLSLEVRPSLYLDTIVNEDVAYLLPDNYKIIKLLNDGHKVLTDEITLGCDPEFFLLKTNKSIALPSKYFNKLDLMGYDGMLAELRPLPSTKPEVVVDNIRNLLRICRQKLNKAGDNDITMHAVSSFNGLAAGFHLHYGIPDVLLKPKNINRRILAKVVQMLDYYVALPCILQEGMEDSLRRSSLLIPYGKIGDFRMGACTLEYRVPGASMLKHPVLTSGLLALGSVVVEDSILHIKNTTDNFTNLDKLDLDKNLTPALPTAKHLHKMICVPNIDAALMNLELIKADINKMTGYYKKKGLIDALFNHLQLKFPSDIEQNWSLKVMYH